MKTEIEMRIEYKNTNAIRNCNFDIVTITVSTSILKFCQTSSRHIQRVEKIENVISQELKRLKLSSPKSWKGWNYHLASVEKVFTIVNCQSLYLALTWILTQRIDVLYIFVNWVDDHQRNSNINERDHLGGQLTTWICDCKSEEKKNKNFKHKYKYKYIQGGF